MHTSSRIPEPDCPVGCSNTSTHNRLEPPCLTYHGSEVTSVAGDCHAWPLLPAQIIRCRVGLSRVDLELRGPRTTNMDGQAVPTQCDPYSLYVQLSRCPSLDGITLLSKARERDFIGNRVPDNMIAAEETLELLSEQTIRAGNPGVE